MGHGIVAECECTVSGHGSSAAHVGSSTSHTAAPPPTTRVHHLAPHAARAARATNRSDEALRALQLRRLQRVGRRPHVLPEAHDLHARGVVHLVPHAALAASTCAVTALAQAARQRDHAADRRHGPHVLLRATVRHALAAVHRAPPAVHQALAVLQSVVVRRTVDRRHRVARCVRPALLRGTRLLVYASGSAPAATAPGHVHLAPRAARAAVARHRSLVSRGTGSGLQGSRHRVGPLAIGGAERRV